MLNRNVPLQERASWQKLKETLDRRLPELLADAEKSLRRNGKVKARTVLPSFFDDTLDSDESAEMALEYINQRISEEGWDVTHLRFDVYRSSKGVFGVTTRAWIHVTPAFPAPR
jgi:hypothetical protein